METSGPQSDIEMTSLPVTPALWNEVNIESEEMGLGSTRWNQDSVPIVFPKQTSDEIEGTHYFTDGVRTVDYVLVWDSSDKKSQESARVTKRVVFESNLVSEGLNLEPDSDGDLTFIKIHVPKKIVIRYAEILKFRKPIKKELCANFPCDDTKSIVKKHMVYDEGPIMEQYSGEPPSLFLDGHRKPKEHQEENEKRRKIMQFTLLGGKTNWNWLQKFLHKYIYVDSKYFPPVCFRYCTTFTRDRLYLFDLHEPNFFSSTDRSRVANFILNRTLFENSTSQDASSFGVNRLINMRVYTAAYPLHDGHFATRGTMRNTLLRKWGSIRMFHRYQPLDYIKDYFGVKIALYFCWLGFYTCMLLPAAVVGVIVFLSGFLHVDDSALSEEVCSSSDIIMCPLCDKYCDFWRLNISCWYSTILSFFDNGGTAFFAAFMSVWSVLFLEMWKRYSAGITHRWDLTGFDSHEEVPRPQYLAKVEQYHKTKKNKVTGMQEKKLPYWRVKVPATLFSFSMVALLVLLAFAACAGVIIYRMAMITASAIYESQQYLENLGDIPSNALVLINVTAGVLNLVALMILTYLYDWLATTLTEYELNRTQTEFDDSLTFKMYLLQFVNFYASIFYLAFIKGKFVGYPGRYRRLLGWRQEECDTAGCLFEVTAQLAIIMIGKQAFNTVLEIVYPLLMQLWRQGFSNISFRPQWVQDYYLEELDIFHEYLEMVLQYGFVTIFVAAFPLAPLCALINNLLESRFDSKKILKYYRRPVTVRVKNIGVWLTILDFVSKFSVFSNALIISFTSEFIPHLVYRLTESPDWSLRGYTNYSLSYFDVRDLDNWSNVTAMSTDNLTDNLCRYKDYRYPPGHKNKYELSVTFWIVLAARLIFMVVFENVVVFLVMVIAWAIPDVPNNLREKIRRETYIVNSILLEQARNAEMKRQTNDVDENEGGYGDDESGDGTEKWGTPNGRLDNGYTSDFSTENLDLASEMHPVLDPTAVDSLLKKKKQAGQFNKDLSKPPVDEALVHRPSDYGDITEETV